MMLKRTGFTLFLLGMLGCTSNDSVEDEIIADFESPTIICPQSIQIIISSTESTAVVAFDTPNATDNVSVTLEQIEGLASGSEFPVGTTVNTFSATDPTGNSANCSFEIEVLQDVPVDSKPYFVGTDPTPEGKVWGKVDQLSDEFNSDFFDDSKWFRNPADDGFRWFGRPPGLFEQDNVTVSGGHMNVRVEQFDNSKVVNNRTYTHGGAIIRSKELARPGYYYECRMKANSTVMSSTFWIAFKQNCNTGPVQKLELDIQECVGRISSQTADWAKNMANIYASNTWRHQRECDAEVDGSRNSEAKTELEEPNNSRFFVYGCWWKSPNEILFYLDGDFIHSITNPPDDFDLDGHITMAIETYNWNPITAEGDLFESGSDNQLTTKYDWVRTWQLLDE